MKECYREINFKKTQLAMIDTINAIINEYMAAGYTLTVRQLYYQLVARDIVPNVEKQYKYITRVVNDARIGGLIDWDAIEDRTREFSARQRWDSPQQIFASAANSYHTDPWATQEVRPFLIVEKEALSGVFQKVCRDYDVPMLSARGYPSASVMREFVVQQVLPSEQEVVVFHFGDHDPSGIDMTRDIDDRCEMFAYSAGHFTLKRLALNIDQVKKHKPPPNPAKTTDARFIGYKRKFGTSSWELDALNPQVLSDLARNAITSVIDAKAWTKWDQNEAKTRDAMRKHAEKFKG
jgi:pentatricopeptide repeat protein